jgi:hypothetical protein
MLTLSALFYFFQQEIPTEKFSKPLSISFQRLNVTHSFHKLFFLLPWHMVPGIALGQKLPLDLSSAVPYPV